MSGSVVVHTLVSIHCGIAAWLIVRNLWNVHILASSQRSEGEGSAAALVQNGGWPIAMLSMNIAVLAMWTSLVASANADCLWGWFTACDPTTWLFLSPHVRGGAHGRARVATGNHIDRDFRAGRQRQYMPKLVLLGLQLGACNALLSIARLGVRVLDGNPKAREADRSTQVLRTGHDRVVWEELNGRAHEGCDVEVADWYATMPRCVNIKTGAVCKSRVGPLSRSEHNSELARSRDDSARELSAVTRARRLWHCSPRVAAARLHLSEVRAGLDSALEGMRNVGRHATRGKDPLDVLALLFLGPYSLAVALVMMAASLASVHLIVVFLHLFLPPQFYAVMVLLYLCFWASYLAVQRAARERAHGSGTHAQARPAYPTVWPNIHDFFTSCRRPKPCFSPEDKDEDRQQLSVRIRPHVARVAAASNSKHNSRTRGRGRVRTPLPLTSPPSVSWAHVLTLVAHSRRFDDVCCVCLEAFLPSTPRTKEVGVEEEVEGSGQSVHCVFRDPVCVCDCSHVLHVHCVDKYNSLRSSGSMPTFQTEFHPLPVHPTPASYSAVHVQQVPGAQAAGQSTGEDEGEGRDMHPTAPVGVPSEPALRGTGQDSDESSDEVDEDSEDEDQTGLDSDSEDDSLRFIQAASLSPIPVPLLVVMGMPWPCIRSLPCCGRRRGGGGRARARGVRAQAATEALSALAKLLLLPFRVALCTLALAVQACLSLCKSPYPLPPPPTQVPRVRHHGRARREGQHGCGYCTDRFVEVVQARTNRALLTLAEALGFGGSKAGLGPPTKCPICRQESGTLRLTELHVTFLAVDRQTTQAVHA